jgi:N-acetylgalactosamine-N,N'-diacetylbacillosaminyl-diphospho-undecaprenol 4-alpha-N-acetylgalactosaminyltransferase
MSAERPRVLFVSKWMDRGGAERFVSTVLQHLDPERFDLRLTVFRAIFGYPIPEGIPVEVLSPAMAHRAWHLAGMIRRLARQLDRDRPDVVVSAYAYPSFVVGAALRLARHRPRWIARVGSNPLWHESGTRHWWMRWLYRRADLFLANSRALMETVGDVYPIARGRIHFQPNPTDFAHIEALAKVPLDDPAPEGSTLVAVGRFSTEKRIDLLIDAVARLQPVPHLVLCGDGPLRDELERRAVQLGLGDRVTFAGFCRNPFQWMARADLFVLCSDYEGSPNALIEAQGLGVPAVATECAFGPSEIVISGETGLLVPTGDSAALADAIAALLADPERRRRMGAAARARARETFAAAPACAELARRIEEVLE